MECGGLQSRWIFTNPDESYLTKVCRQIFNKLEL